MKVRGIEKVPKYVLRDWLWRLVIYEGDFIKIPKSVLEKELKRNRSKK